jgi:aspartate/tyrosine/aromatic aminotransferase
MKLAYGADASVLQNKQVAAVQALSGTGACRLMAEFTKRYLPNSKVLIPKPTWSNHHNIVRDAGVGKEEFRYYDPSTQVCSKSDCTLMILPSKLDMSLSSMHMLRCCMHDNNCLWWRAHSCCCWRLSAKARLCRVWILTA